MEKEYDEEVEKIDDDYSYEEPTEEEKELLEIDKEQSTKLKNGQVEFKKVNHSERAAKLGRVSDGDITKYVNVALEYFGHRCALSGERFKSFDKKVDGKKSNLSAEHVVALCLDGDDIVPNIVPTVLQYNLRKNGYYLLDYWDKQKDTEGKSLYSPYRLLKLVNYMMKSIEARNLKSIKYYRKAIMTPNEIDELLAEIEKQDELEPDNSKKKIHSDTITATTVDEDNKKILTEVPQVEGNIPTQREQQERFRQNEIDMMDIFLADAVGLLNRTEELQQVRLKDKVGNEISLQDKLDEMLKTSIGVIPFEVEVRNVILEKLETLGVQNNKYSIANELLNNTPILELSKENRENVKFIVEDYIGDAFLNIDVEATNEQKISLISSNPALLYDRNEIEDLKTNIERYRRYIGDAINFEILDKTYLINALKIENWCELNYGDKEIWDRKLPNSKSKDEEEKRLGRALANLRQKIKQYEGKELEDVENKEDRIILEIVRRLDEEYGLGNSLKSALKIENWCITNYGDKEIWDRKLPSRTLKDEEEESLGIALFALREKIQQYEGKELEDVENKEDRKILEIVRRLEEDYGLGDSLKSALKIENWCITNYGDKEIWDRKLPNKRSKDEEEKSLGGILGHLRQKIKQYEGKELGDVENKEDRRILEIVRKLDEEYGLSNPLKNALKIEKWCKKNYGDKEIWKRKLPSSTSKDEEEKRLGIALHSLIQKVKQYEGKELGDVENKEDRRILEIVRRLEEDYGLSDSLKNVLEIEDWCKKNYGDKEIWDRKLPSSTSKDEEEKRLGIALHTLRQKIKQQYEGTELENIENEDRRILEIVRRLEEDYGLGDALKSALKIENWCKTNYGNKEKWDRKLPNQKSKEEEEKRLGTTLANLRQKIKQYEGKELEDVENREDRRILEIVRRLDEEYGLGDSLKNALKIENWCKTNYGDKEIWARKLPSPTAKDEEEKRLGTALANLRNRIKKYEGIELEYIENEEDRRILEIIRRLYEEYNPKKIKQQALQQAKAERDKAKLRNNQAKELEQQVSEQLKKRGQTHDEQ